MGECEGGVVDLPCGVLVEQKVEGWGGRPNAPKQPNDNGAWFAVMSDVNQSFQNGEAQALFKGPHPPSAAQFMGKCNTCMRKLQGIFSECGNSESCVMQKNPPKCQKCLCWVYESTQEKSCPIQRDIHIEF